MKQTRDELLKELMENMDWLIESWEQDDHEAIVVNRTLCYDTLDKLEALKTSEGSE